MKLVYVGSADGIRFGGEHGDENFARKNEPFDVPDEDAQTIRERFGEAVVEFQEGMELGDVPPVAAVLPAKYDFDIQHATVDAVVEWVGDDPDRARWALDQERAADVDVRVTLEQELQKVLQGK